MPDLNEYGDPPFVYKPPDPEATIKGFMDRISEPEVYRYTTYWQNIKPTNHEEYYKRWLFAYLSVHTTWSANVRAYVKLAKEEFTDKEKLLQIITVSRVGLHKVRSEGMWKFKNEFWANPEDWYKKPDESWTACRDRLMKRCHGLGYAKTAFALELCYPIDCEVTCLDTHMLQLYGAKYGSVPSPSKYKELEQNWVSKCKEKGFPPFMVRNIYWDKIQTQLDTRYWSYVFEKPVGEII